MDYTKGPWEAFKINDPKVNPEIWAKYEQIAEVTGTVANANLIAAAPDLLWAAQKAAQGAHHPACPIATGKGHTTINRDDCSCHVGIARTAITKALPPA